MAFFHRTEVELSKTGTRANVPDDPKANLMYYFDCICTLLQLDDDDGDFDRLRRYSNYRSLSDADTSLLITLCYMLSPDTLMDKCIFQSDAMCGDSSNEFYSIESASKHLMVAGSIMIGGHRKRVAKIMTFKMSWLRENYIEPMRTLSRQQSQRRAIQSRRSNDGSCVVS